METKKSIILSEKAPSREHVWLNTKDNSLRYFNGQKWIAVGCKEEVIPVVIGVDRDREIPSNLFVSYDKTYHFAITFDPMEYVHTVQDYSCDIDGVNVCIDDLFDNILIVNVDHTVAYGTTGVITFKGTPIINITVVEPSPVEIEAIWNEQHQVITELQVEDNLTYELYVQFSNSYRAFPFEFNFTGNPDAMTMTVDQSADSENTHITIHVNNAEDANGASIYFRGQLFMNVKAVAKKTIDITVSSTTIPSVGSVTSDIKQHIDDLATLEGAHMICENAGLSAPATLGYYQGMLLGVVFEYGDMSDRVQIHNDDGRISNSGSEKKLGYIATINGDKYQFIS